MGSFYWMLSPQAILVLFCFISSVYSDDKCDDDDDDCDGGNGGIVVALVFGCIAGILIILAIITFVCVKFCKTTRHGAVINPDGGNSNQVTFSQGYTHRPQVFTTGYMYTTPTAPPYSGITSQTFVQTSSVFPGQSSSTGNIPPPPSYDEVLSNNTSPPKY
ncbi:uncharacterized protein LOC133194430 [Saccostrea echinata]|uniref:uncharacterized protein LOC133194430 n=1 Tax=Saccostrea echinata TaxID=191078 RepID=UPI002A8182CC|nr:uncharacterized protein LOC133194430 [Saccostrea echinata]